jgi:hypothetical protein
MTPRQLVCLPPAEITLDAAQLEELAQDIVADRHKAIREAVRCSYVEID